MGPQFEGDTGGVDLYVGGVEHAVLHLLYARFWHKVLFDLGHLSSSEPFRRLFNQGYIQAAAYTDDRGLLRRGQRGRRARRGASSTAASRCTREFGKMGKSLKNMVTPDDMYAEYGADTLRLYEMFTGPLDQSRPWETKAVVGVFRLLQRIWRNVLDEDTGAVRVADAAADDETRRILHRVDRRGPRRHGDAAVQHVDRQDHRAQQPPDAAVPGRRRAPRGRRAARPDAGAARAAHRRGAVVAAGPRRSRSPGSPSRRPTPRCSSRTRSRSRCRSTARSGRGSRVAAGLSAARPRGRRPCATPRSPSCSAGATVRKVIAVPDKLVNFVVG